MPSARLTLLAIALLAIGALAVSTATAAPSDHPEIVGLYPNPVADEDAGEFVVLSVPGGANLSQYAISDGDSTVDIPAVTANRTVAFSTDANRTAPLLDRPVHQLPGHLALANGGETVELVRGNESVDQLSYADAPEGERLRVSDGNTAWRHLGATDRPVVAGAAGHVEAFVLPDAGSAPTDLLADADDRILLAGYTLTSETVAAILERAHRRNVTVRVLAEGSPVGGLARRQATRLDRLADAGIEVRVVGGNLARYRYHHAKYAVVDDRALVTTENWKPAGTGGHGSRGWGAITNQSRIVDGLAATFRADAGWRDAIPWHRYRQGINTTESEPATRTFRKRVDPETVPVDSTRLLVAPDNAEGTVVDAIEDAEDSIWIEQAGVGGVNQPFVRASVDAARRGVTVRLLLDDSWYNREENRAVADRLAAVAQREDLDLAVRLVDPRGRFEKIHAKGAVIDGEQVLLGSLNWNNHSARENREVALLLSGAEIGEYYEEVIRGDWHGGSWQVTVGLLAAALLAVLVALEASRSIRFEPVGR